MVAASLTQSAHNEPVEEDEKQPSPQKTQPSFVSNVQQKPKNNMFLKKANDLSKKNVSGDKPSRDIFSDLKKTNKR